MATKLDQRPKKGEPSPTEKPQEERLIAKRNLGAAIVALEAFAGATMAQAWKALHPDAGITDIEARDRAIRAKNWYLEHFPPAFLSVLELNHVGRQRLAQLLQEGARATRYCQYQKKQVPDMKIRMEAAKLIAMCVGITSSGDHVKESLRHSAKSAAEIDAGPQFDDPDEWYRQAQIVEARAQETYVPETDLE